MAYKRGERDLAPYGLIWLRRTALGKEPDAGSDTLCSGQSAVRCRASAMDR